MSDDDRVAPSPTYTMIEVEGCKTVASTSTLASENDEAEICCISREISKGWTIDWSDSWGYILQAQMEGRRPEDYTVLNRSNQVIDPFVNPPDKIQFPLRFVPRAVRLSVRCEKVCFENEKFQQKLSNRCMHNMGGSVDYEIVKSVFPEQKVTFIELVFKAGKLLQVIMTERCFHSRAAQSVCQHLDVAKEGLTDSARAEDLRAVQGILKMVEHLDYLGPKSADMDAEFYDDLPTAKSQSLAALGASPPTWSLPDEAIRLFWSLAAVACADGVADAGLLGEALTKLCAAQACNNFYQTFSIAMRLLEHFRRKAHEDCLDALRLCQDTADANGFSDFGKELESATKEGSLTLALEAVQKAIGEVQK